MDLTNLLLFVVALGVLVSSLARWLPGRRQLLVGPLCVAALAGSTLLSESLGWLRLGLQIAVGALAVVSLFTMPRDVRKRLWPFWLVLGAAVILLAADNLTVTMLGRESATSAFLADAVFLLIALASVLALWYLWRAARGDGRPSGGGGDSTPSHAIVPPPRSPRPPDDARV